MLTGLLEDRYRPRPDAVLAAPERDALAEPVRQALFEGHYSIYSWWNDAHGRLIRLLAHTAEHTDTTAPDLGAFIAVTGDEDAPTVLGVYDDEHRAEQALPPVPPFRLQEQDRWQRPAVLFVPHLADLLRGVRTAAHAGEIGETLDHVSARRSPAQGHLPQISEIVRAAAAFTHATGTPDGAVAAARLRAVAAQLDHAADELHDLQVELQDQVSLLPPPARAQAQQPRPALAPMPQAAMSAARNR